MERVVLETMVFLAAVGAVVYFVVYFLDRWAKRKRIERMWHQGNKGPKP